MHTALRALTARSELHYPLRIGHLFYPPQLPPPTTALCATLNKAMTCASWSTAPTSPTAQRQSSALSPRCATACDHGTYSLAVWAMHSCGRTSGRGMAHALGCSSCSTFLKHSMPVVPWMLQRCCALQDCGHRTQHPTLCSRCVSDLIPHTQSCPFLCHLLSQLPIPSLTSTHLIDAGT
jgi:hypothetical protein